MPARHPPKRRRLNPLRLIRPVLSILLIALFTSHSAGWLQMPLFDRLEHWAYDFRLLATQPEGRDERIVIVDIDERSLAAVGHWPWRRDRLATLTDQLFERYKVRTLGIDLVFAEPDSSDGLEVLGSLSGGLLRGWPSLNRELEALRPRFDYDSHFAAALTDRSVATGYYFRPRVRDNEPVAVGALPAPAVRREQLPEGHLPLIEAAGYVGNLADLQAAARRGGFFDNPLADADGVFRRMPLLQFYEGELYSSFALSVLENLAGDARVHLGLGKQGGDTSYLALEEIQLGGWRIPVDERGGVLVPYLGNGRDGGSGAGFDYVSAVDVLLGNAPPELLEGRIALLGSSASGLGDIRSTPVAGVLPGVEVHANIIAGVLDWRIHHQPAWVLGLETLALLITGVVLAIMLPRLQALATSLVSIGTLLAIVAANLFAWQAWKLVLPLADSLLLVASLFVLHLAHGYFAESRDKRRLQRVFSQYVPPSLVAEIRNNPGEVTLEAESREMTVLFADLRGFTTFAEQLPPADLAKIVNAYLTAMTEVIHNHRGTIDKYIGDAVMAFWGAPLPDRHHAENALAAALDMLRTVRNLQPRFRRQGWPDLQVGIGISTGQMSVGNLGSNFRIAYTVLGDAVNLGSRLEGLTKHYAVNVLVSDATRHAAPGYRYRELDRVRVRGKRAPVSVYEPIGLIDSMTAEQKAELRSYHQALALYRRRAWTAAEREFLTLAQDYPGQRLYSLYLKRINYYREHPPPKHWDGVFAQLPRRLQVEDH